MTERAVAGSGRTVLLRLGPGEEVCRALVGELERIGASAAAVVAAAGSLASVVYAIVSRGDDGHPRHSDPLRCEGMIEIVALQGHLGRSADGRGDFHLHGAFSRQDGSLVAGHVMEGTVLVTVEATLLVSSDVAWERRIATPDGSVSDAADGPRFPLFFPTQR